MKNVATLVIIGDAFIVNEPTNILLSMCPHLFQISMTRQMPAVLDYEPHTNLSINTKKASECCSLTDIRFEIDTIDHFITKLLHERLQYVRAASQFKSNVAAIPAPERVIQQLKQRKKWAEEYELDSEYMEAFFKRIIDWNISQQIAHYKDLNPNEKSIEVKLASLNELKVIEHDLDWIDISHYSKLLRAGHRKASDIGEPVLVSFTQKTSIFDDNGHSGNLTPFNLFEQCRRRALSHAFILAQPSRQFLMLALGSAHQFDVNEGTPPFNGMGKKISDLTRQEFQAAVKDVLSDGWKRLLANAIIENRAGNDVPVHGPTLSGGICFDHQNSHRSKKWSSFGETSFSLPLVQFTQQGASVYVTFNTLVAEYDRPEHEMEFIDTRVASLLKFCDEIINGASRLSNGSNHNEALNGDNPIDDSAERTVSPDDWKQTVRDALTKISSGEFQKVVLAREAQLGSGEHKVSCDIGWSLKRLSSLHPSSHIFGVLRQQSCFLGATPEQLVRLCGGQLESAAVAGTTPRGATDTDDETLRTELFNSVKQRYEHNLVVELLRSKLETMTEANSLSIPDEPTVLKLASLQHLYTPMRGTIKNGTTIVDLVQALHPTPAVGGSPQADALKFIRESENLDRGWYAAPVGWIDADSNGEFVVALRSGLVSGASMSLFAGCGIVDGSDPDDELNETRLKMKTMLSALDQQLTLA